ncbi:MAG: hypothetical protein V1809_11485 [Planctomycetota bacterium]
MNKHAPWVSLCLFFGCLISSVIITKLGFGIEGALCASKSTMGSLVIVCVVTIAGVVIGAMGTVKDRMNKRMRTVSGIGIGLNVHLAYCLIALFVDVWGYKGMVIVDF